MGSDSGSQINNKNVAIIVGLTLFVAFLSLMVLSGKGSSNSANDNSDNISEEDVMGENVEDAAELKVEILEEGDGALTKIGDTISVHYTGTLLDGTMFDSSVGRGMPYQFTLGAGDVIDGWDKGLVGVKVGSKLKLTIPSDMGYGETGRPPYIPGGAGLLFEIEVLEIK